MLRHNMFSSEKVDLPAYFYSIISRFHCLQFDRERIPERVVHARGATAKGFFEVISTHIAHSISIP